MLVNFHLARDGVSLQEVLAFLGLPQPRGTLPQRYGPCPLKCCNPWEVDIPRGKRRARLRCCGFNFERKVWRCCRCDRGGNHLDLIMQMRDVSAYEAVQLIYNHFNRQVPFLVPVKRGGS